MSTMLFALAISLWCMHHEDGKITFAFVVPRLVARRSINAREEKNQRKRSCLGLVQFESHRHWYYCELCCSFPLKSLNGIAFLIKSRILQRALSAALAINLHQNNISEQPPRAFIFCLVIYDCEFPWPRTSGCVLLASTTVTTHKQIVPVHRRTKFDLSFALCMGHKRKIKKPGVRRTVRITTTE